MANLTHLINPEVVGKNRLDEGVAGIFIREMGTFSGAGVAVTGFIASVPCTTGRLRQNPGMA